MNSPRNVFFVFLILSQAFSLQFARAQEVQEHQFLVKVGDMAPDFEARLTDGTLFKLSENRGKVVMLQFTASWCGVCREEMPHIQKLIWESLRNKDFVVIGVDYKEDKLKSKQFASDMKISYPLAIDSIGEIFHRFAQKGAGVTRNVIIDKNGKIIFLTRLFKMDEFLDMKDLIFKAVHD
jgi:peroxiredoxin